MHPPPMHLTPHIARPTIARKAAVLIAAAAILLVVGGAPRAELRTDRPEQILFDAANRERAARGLSQLRWDEEVAEAARRHAMLMMSQNVLSHQLTGELDLVSRMHRTGARFIAVAENVAVGPSPTGLHQQWMNSAPHRENLLDPEMTAMGAAIADRDGSLFAVEDFTQTLDDLPFVEQERKIGSELAGHGLRVVSDGAAPTDARRVCEGEPGRLDVRGRMFYFRYGTEDLAKLPSALLQELEGRHYHIAAVGACQPSQNSGYASYEIAILLYE